MDQTRNQDMIENALWKIECLINFHQNVLLISKKSHQNNFPRLREAPALARQQSYCTYPGHQYQRWQGFAAGRHTGQTQS